MLVLFMRHGEAEPASPGVRDEDRRLTGRGRLVVEAVARLLSVRPVVAYTSPLARAVETGEIVCRIHGCRVEVRRELHPDDFSIDALGGMGLGDAHLLVGHNPSMREVVEGLVGGSVSLSPGSVAIVEAGTLRPGGGRLAALLNPRFMSLDA